MESRTENSSISKSLIPAPGTPKTPISKAERARVNAEINQILESLSGWGIDLLPNTSPESPSKRRLRAMNNEEQSEANKCSFMIKFLRFKSDIFPTLSRFDQEARQLYSEWVRKPKGDRDTLPPSTRQNMRPMTLAQRRDMQRLLHDLLEAKFEQVRGPASPSKLTAHPGIFVSKSFSGMSTSKAITSIDPAKSFGGLDASKSFSGSITGSITPKVLLASEPTKDFAAKTSRPFIAGADSITSFCAASEVREVAGAIESADADLGTDVAPIPFILTPKRLGSKRTRKSGEDERQFKIPKLPNHKETSTRSGFSTRACSRASSRVRGFEPRSADTSFTSHNSAVFSQSDHRYVTQSTQTTIEDEAPEVATQAEQDQLYDDAIAPSIEYWGSSFDATDIKSLGLDVVDAEDQVDPRFEALPNEEKLRIRLRNVFPELPPSLNTAPFCARYEFTRVLLYTGSSQKDFEIPPSLDLENYDELWKFLRDSPALQGKSLPERCSLEAWRCGCSTFRRDFHAVNMSGSLRFSTTSGTSPFFRLQLAPLRLELGHRFGRRFGNDRFLELDMPYLSGNKGRAPKLLQSLGEQGRDIILEWLVKQEHQMLGRAWCPFYVKPKDGKAKKLEVTEIHSEELNGVTAQRVYFFASDGLGFSQRANIPPESEKIECHTTMSISSLLNWLRPLRKNAKQPFLKLFSRTSLALSRTYATVVIPRRSIRRKADIINGVDCMTDGAGQMSPALAQRITQVLGLTYVPSGFQGRIGEAKGFWSTDTEDRSGVEWIDVYDSQAKWTPGSKPASRSNDPCHRTFEVLKPSGPLRSADLNLQLLPILVDRALSKQHMVNSISQILQDGLEKEMNEQHAAMQDPLLLRKWLREKFPNLKERVNGRIARYRAALPEKFEDKINLLIDSGFNPKHLPYLREMAWIAYRTHCDTLKKKMNITVGKSAYVYMVPDFSGSLAPNEVFLDFSTFKDDTGYPTTLLKNVDVLVARSPAHYVSDVQRVMAVYKAELIGLKDVIVFSTQGNPSLASKLSGGDYDGDMAWVCWEPRIVENFRNADIPSLPDLVKDGILAQTKTEYEVLTKGLDSQLGVQKFLKESFDFNMQQSMLGICTNYKDELCYRLGNVNSEHAVLLSTLLSNLVDQAKQGYIFTDESWSRLKKGFNVYTAVPAYKAGQLNYKSDHILDKLFIVAHAKIESTLAEFNTSLGKPQEVDADLVRFYNTARQQAQIEPQWKVLLDDLDSDIQEVLQTWRSRWAKKVDNEEDKGRLNIITAECYELFQKILPRIETPLTQFLSSKWLPVNDMCLWALLRASATFKANRRGAFCWWMAGKQLARLKADSRSESSIAIVPEIYAGLKPDATFIKLTRNGIIDGTVLEAMNQGGLGQDGVEMED